MALTADEQAFLDFALSALPRWMTSSDEFLNACAVLFGGTAGVKGITDYWFSQTRIGDATGAGSGTPDWLRQHARDRGTDRQSGEPDPALRTRLRSVSDALTRQTLIAAANAILAAQGIGGTAAIVELPRDGAHVGTFTSDTGTGGTFATNGSSFEFTPTVRFAMPPFRDPSVVRLVQQYSLVIAGAASGANNGTFPITGLSLNGALYVNGGGAPGVDAGATWTTRKLDRRGNLLDGHGKAHVSRGFRTSPKLGKPFAFVLILPFGTTPGVTAGIVEMLRQKKAAGFKVIIETRQHP